LKKELEQARMIEYLHWDNVLLLLRHSDYGSIEF